MSKKNHAENILKAKSIAIVGATQNTEKHGYKIFRMFKDKKHVKVYPINPKYTEIEGVKCHSSISELSEIPEVASVVTPPAVSEKILEEVIKKGVKTVWFQPGAEPKNIKELQKKYSGQIDIIYGLCVLKL